MTFEDINNYYYKLSNSLIKFMKIVRKNQGKIILICDDERFNALSLKRNLKKFFLEIYICQYIILIKSDAIKALNLIYFNALFHLIISTIIIDLHM